ncbi:MAG: sugar phosphate nucleotidyltransferase [Flavobacteriaceae bacterium]|nr:sugar phosphate nucleotidyltransferase [Flavobacteriaceae bacterium]
MKIIVPMAGRGSRLRPHTLSVPKPLIPVAGMPIVHRLVRDIAQLLPEAVTEIAYILGDPAFFGADVVASLTELSDSLGAKTSIYRQDEPLGTGHALICAAPSLSGPAVVAYADTLIRANLTLDPEADSVIWVKKVNNPEQFGVVQLDDTGAINSLVEKPKDFVSDLAVIGIYYFKNIAFLKEALEGVLNEKLTHGGEYQINDGILRMMQSGKRFVPGEVLAWMDCGNAKVTLQTNKQMLDFLATENEALVGNVTLQNSTIIPPCFIGDNVTLTNSTVGPHASIGAGTTLTNSEVKNSIIQTHCAIKDATLNNAMIGNHVHFNGSFTHVSIGDHSVLE